MTTASWSALASLPSQVISGPNFGSQAVSGNEFDFTGTAGGKLKTVTVAVSATDIQGFADTAASAKVIVTGVAGKVIIPVSARIDTIFHTTQNAGGANMAFCWASGSSYNSCGLTYTAALLNNVSDAAHQITTASTEYSSTSTNLTTAMVGANLVFGTTAVGTFTGDTTLNITLMYLLI